MAKPFHLEIVSPERIFFTGLAEELVFPSIDGLYGVLAGHEPTVTALQAGELRFKVEGRWQIAAVSDGFVEIMPDYVILLAGTVERPEEIDVNRAKAALERAEERLRQRKSQEEYVRSQAAMARAMARLKASGKNL